jgi:hypothetical protein
LTRRRLDAQVKVDNLNTTVDAIRKGFQGGTLESKREDGRVYMCLDTVQDTAGGIKNAQRYLKNRGEPAILGGWFIASEEPLQKIIDRKSTTGGFAERDRVAKEASATV